MSRAKNRRQRQKEKGRFFKAIKQGLYEINNRGKLLPESTSDEDKYIFEKVNEIEILVAAFKLDTFQKEAILSEVRFEAAKSVSKAFNASFANVTVNYNNIY